MADEQTAPGRQQHCECRLRWNEDECFRRDLNEKFSTNIIIGQLGSWIFHGIILHVRVAPYCFSVEWVLGIGREIGFDCRPRFLNKNSPIERYAQLRSSDFQYSHLIFILPASFLCFHFEQLNSNINIEWSNKLSELLCFPILASTNQMFELS